MFCLSAPSFINIASFPPRTISVSKGLNGRPIRILTNPNPFRQGEVNFVETVFYNELVLDDESPIPRTSGAPALEKEEEGRGTYNLRNLLDRKRQKKEASSSGSRECVVVQEPNIPLMKVRGTQMHYAGRSRTTRLYDGSRRDLGGSRERSTDLARRGARRS